MKLYYKIKKDPTVNEKKKKTGPGNKSLRMESSREIKSNSLN
jgi:hypothetical protein